MMGAVRKGCAHFVYNFEKISCSLSLGNPCTFPLLCDKLDSSEVKF